MKHCALPNCEKPVTNWRLICCCLNHQRRYNGLRKTNKVPPVVNRHMVSWRNHNKVQEFYALAKNLTEQTGIPHEVDHIVPINSKQVCGLHNEFNLRVVPRSNNRQKGNGSWQELLGS